MFQRYNITYNWIPTYLKFIFYSTFIHVCNLFRLEVIRSWSIIIIIMLKLKNLTVLAWDKVEDEQVQILILNYKYLL